MSDLQAMPITNITTVLVTGFRLAMSEWGSNGLTIFRIRGPNSITKSPPTLLVFWTFGHKPSLNGEYTCYTAQY